MDTVINIFINIFIWYCIGYVLSFVGIYFCNKMEQRETPATGITEALQISFLSWIVVIIAFIVFTGIDNKFNATFEKLNEKFKGEK